MHRRKLIVSCLSASIAGPALAGVTTGKPAPLFEIKTLSDGTLGSQSLVGKVVILSFWATWCGPCRLEMPALEAYYAAHENEGLEVIAVSMDDPGQDKMVRDIMAKYSFASAFQREAKIKGYGRIWSLPMAFVIDRKGILRHDGSRKAAVFDAQSLEKIVTPLLLERH
jgi:cytochrome c biogenesis protein CcmG/thiol:disulfide interchange protein DsbE